MITIDKILPVELHKYDFYLIMLVFENILICSFVHENTKPTIETEFHTSFEIAKKFNSQIILLKCIHNESSTFRLFKTKSYMKKQNELDEKINSSLDEFKKMATQYNIPVKTESTFVDSLSESITEYIHKNKIDLLIVDSSPPTDINFNDYKEIVNRIYRNVDCPILTLK